MSILVLARGRSDNRKIKMSYQIWRQLKDRTGNAKLCIIPSCIETHDRKCSHREHFYGIHTATLMVTCEYVTDTLLMGK